MDQNLSWSKAYIISAALHIFLFLLFAMGLAVIVAEKEQQVYVIDLTTSDFSPGSGHEGGGGGGNESLFPEPLKEEEVAKRVEAAQQTVPMTTPTEPAITPAQETVTLPSSDKSISPAPAADKASSTTSSSTSGGSGSGTGTGTGEGSGTGIGFGSGSGSGAGDGTGDGQGVGEGSGAGQGSGDGNVSGTGSAPFDINGFWAAVNAQKEYPYMAMKRHLEGTTTIVTTIDASGTIIGVSVASSSGQSILDDAAVAAARAVGSYPNPTGTTVSVSTNVNFSIR